MPDTWLLYAVASLMDGKPRLAVHSLDLGIGTWLPGEVDRAVLTWCRGVVVMDRLNDPRTALDDLHDAEKVLPHWLAEGSSDRIERCVEWSALSRKRKPTAQPRPLFTGSARFTATVAPPHTERADGTVPDVWPHVAAFFAS